MEGERILHGDGEHMRKNQVPEEVKTTHELPVYITTDCHRTPHRLHIGLLHQDLPCLQERGIHFECIFLKPTSPSATGNENTVVVLSGSVEIKETDLVAKLLDIGL